MTLFCCFCGLGIAMQCGAKIGRAAAVSCIDLERRPGRVRCSQAEAAEDTALAAVSSRQCSGDQWRHHASRPARILPRTAHIREEHGRARPQVHAPGCEAVPCNLGGHIRLFCGSYKSPFTYADAKKTDGYSSFVDMEDTEKEYEEAKQGCVLK